MQPDPTFLLQSLDISLPLIGFYDAPDPAPFAPLVEPKAGDGRGTCVFAFYREWLQGATLHLDREDFRVCGGAARALSRIERRAREEFLHFLAIEEGLKASEDLMGEWIDANPGYEPTHRNLLIGPLKAEQYEHLKTVTFWTNADQMSALTIAVQYYSAPNDPPPLVARFAAGCGQMLGVFDDLGRAQAQIGATDIAMRQWLPPELLAVTVTKPMFEQLCTFDVGSYLNKPFLGRLKKARGGRLA